MGFISGLFQIYIYIIIADVIISYVPAFQDNEIARTIKKGTEPVLSQIRKFLPSDLPIDFSPFVAIGLIFAVQVLW